jgi:hypothetical protein
MPRAATMDRSPHSPPYKRYRPEQTLHLPDCRAVLHWIQRKPGSQRKPRDRNQAIQLSYASGAIA